MPNSPIADPAKCDVPGCGRYAMIRTDGSEEDVQGLKRAALPNINLCNPHQNWAHSEDAKLFALSEVYRKRTKL